MAATRFSQPESRKPAGSPRPKGRENAKDTLCRNVLIYGHCRYEDQGCSFNHDPNRAHTAAAQPEIKKALNVDSPAFTPSTLSVPAVKQQTLSSQAANAAPFTPRVHVSGTVTPNPQLEPEAVSTTFNPATIKEFTPQNYDLSQALGNGTTADAAYADPFTMQSMNQELPTSFNPYENTAAAMATNPAAAATYFGGNHGFAAPAQPPQYHLYAPIGPHREDLLPYQRTVHDFFIDDNLRELYHKKSVATLQVMPNSQLPNVEHFHSLVALDTSNHESVAIFGYPTWVYKAQSSKNGKYYALRRLRGYRLSNEGAIRAVKAWKAVQTGGVVEFVDAFTTRAFGDSSLIIVYNYHPLSKTLIEHHLNTANRYSSRSPLTSIPEKMLWSYVVQIACAMKLVHAAGLAVRCIDLTKVIVTDKNRIRFNACGILDVIQFEANRPLVELQQEDLILFGKLILCLATNTSSMSSAAKLSVDQLARTYSEEFRDTLTWLLNPAQPDGTKSINELVRGIAQHIVDNVDGLLHAQDNMTSEFTKEMENGRLARLLMKLDVVNDRPEHQNNPKYAETGERYVVKLFRDYVFHQVDANGKAAINLGHIITALNKLDAGSNQMIMLTTRDEATCMYMTYKEVKKQFAAAFDEVCSQQGKGITV